MKHGIHFGAAGHATCLFLGITFALCVGFDLIFPHLAMYRTWQALLPGFKWITWRSFILGAVESYAYGWYITLIWVPLYNVPSARAEKR